MFLLFNFLVLILAVPMNEPATRLIGCGGAEVFVLTLSDSGSPQKTWSWTAEDSPTIPAASRKWFGTTDDCKPAGASMLITSSGGGVALIRRADKHCLFLAYGRNAHSACLVPGRTTGDTDRIMVAESTGGDRLSLHRMDEGAMNSQPIAQLPLAGAHGAVWDDRLERLWALGEDRLLLVQVIDEVSAESSTDSIKTRLSIEQSWGLPSFGGHDLQVTSDPHELFITTDEHVYRFHKTTHAFTLDATLGSVKKVKSVSVHPTTGEFVYQQATPANWWGHEIRFVGERATIAMPDERLYKIRWDDDGGSSAQ